MRAWDLRRRETTDPEKSLFFGFETAKITAANDPRIRFPTIYVYSGVRTFTAIKVK
jgi:hypothetical protein